MKKKVIVKKNPAKGLLKAGLLVSIYFTGITMLGAIVGGIVAAILSTSNQKL